jgi:hypothetical protein
MNKYGEMLHFMNKTLAVPLTLCFVWLVLLLKDDSTEDLTESIPERILPAYTNLYFHCPNILIHLLSVLYVVAVS